MSLQSVLRLATGWAVQGSNPGGEAKIYAPVQTGPGAHTISYTVGTGRFPGVKRTERRVDHTPSSSPEVKEKVQLYLWAFVACSSVNFTFMDVCHNEGTTHLECKMQLIIL